MALIAIIDSDSKIAAQIQEAAEPACKEFNHLSLPFTSLADFDKYLAENKAPPISLMVVDSDQIPQINKEKIADFKNKYKAPLIITGYHDPAHPFKNIETWPAENIIYKPFDLPILKEHLRFSLSSGKKIQTQSVHTNKDSLHLEKIRRHVFTALSDFGFKFKSKSRFEIGHTYKFYHFIFKDQNKLSLWARPVHVENDEYEFVYATPKPNVMNHVRKQIQQAQEKLKNIHFKGLQKNKDLKKIKLGLEMLDSQESQKLVDFLNRHFPDIALVKIDAQVKETLNAFQIVISEAPYTAKDYEKRFGKDTLYFCVNNEMFRNAEHAEEHLAYETVRLSKPIDRVILSHLITSYFPGVPDCDPNPPQWITVPEEALLSETITAQDFSEVGFVYNRDKPLAPGNYQEFALSQEDENELKPIKAKIHFSDDKPAADKLYPHQIVFFGVRDDILKRIRLWMLQAHIIKKNSGS